MNKPAASATPPLFGPSPEDVSAMHRELLLACADLQETEDGIKRNNEHNAAILKTARRRVDTAVRALRESGQVTQPAIVRAPYRDPEEGSQP